MKKTRVLLLALAMVCFCASALGELGFAEIKKDNVNVRESAGGKTLWQLNAPQSVYVFEEKTVGKYLWCHVSTYIGKNPKTGWIRGDMLRFLSEEFTDVVDVEAGTHYVLGIRKDGTVAIMGDDMPHSPCIETVRKWKNMKQVCTESVGVQGITNDGVVRAVGRQENLEGMKAHRICRPFAYPIDKHDEFAFDEWNRAWGWDTTQETSGLRGLKLFKVTGVDVKVDAALTADGEMIIFKEEDELGQSSWADWLHDMAFDHAPYTDMDQFHGTIVALRADGRVEAECMDEPAAEKTQSWENVVRVAAGNMFTIGLKADGTVYFAGADEKHRRQVEAWDNISDISAGQDFCVGLKTDGTVVMAGHYHENYFR